MGGSGRGRRGRRAGGAGPILLLAAAALLAPGCGDGQGPPPAVDWDAVEDDPAVVHALRWLGPPFFPSALPDTHMELQVEQHFKLELDPIFLDLGAYARRKPLMCVGGDIPDVMVELSPTLVRRDAYHGFLLELPVDLILRHAPDYVAQLNALYPKAWLGSHAEGRNWALPLTARIWSNPRPGMWRMDWLEQVGISEVPGTLEEMFEAFRRFRDRDPDGDGERNTTGMMPGLGTGDGCRTFFGLYHLLPFGWIKRDGEVVWGGVHPDAKRALGHLRQMHLEGLLDPDWVATPPPVHVNTTRKKIESGRIGYAAHFGSWIQVSEEVENDLSIAHTLRQLCPTAKLVPGRYLEHEGRRARHQVGPAAPWFLAFGRQLAHEPEKVIRVLEMINTIAVDPALHVFLTAGREGEHWAYDELVGLQFIGKYSAERKNHLLAHIYSSHPFFVPFSLTLEQSLPYMSRYALDYLDRYQHPRDALVQYFGYGDAVPGADRLVEQLRSFQLQTYVEIATGERPLDDFEWFVEEWYARGGAEATALARAFDREVPGILAAAGVDAEDLR